MPSTIKRYAIEHDTHEYGLARSTLSTGFAYNGVELFDTFVEAQASINESIAHAIDTRDANNIDEDDVDYLSDAVIEEITGRAVEVVLHADGRIFNAYGGSISASIGRPYARSAAHVESHIAEYFKHASNVARNPVLASDSPQP
jgi:hypothetical protein